MTETEAPPAASVVEPRRKSFFSTRTVFVSFAVIVTGVAAMSYFYGFAAAGSFLNRATALVSQTLKDVLDSDHQTRLATEVDLGAGGEAPRATTTAAGTNTSLAVAGGSAVSDADSARKNAAPKNSGTKGASLVSGSPKTSSSSAAISPAAVSSSPPAYQNSSLSADVGITPPPLNEKTSAESKSVAIPICGFFAGGAPNHQIILNEIAWMGSAAKNGESAPQAGDNEWLELKNNSSATVDLGGSQILDDSEKFNIVFDKHAALPAGEFALLERSDDNSVSGIAADKIYFGALSNSGEWLRLFDKKCELLDEIDARAGWPAGDNATKATLERNLFNFGWHTSAAPGGTPKAQNSNVIVDTFNPPSSLEPASAGELAPIVSPEQVNSTSTLAASSAPSDSGQSPQPAPEPSSSTNSGAPNHLLIAAVQIAGASSTNDFIKIYNPMSAPVDISGWKLRKRTKPGSEYSVRTFPASGVIQPQNYFVWANSVNNFSASLGADVSSTETLAADNSVALEDASNVIMDALAWGSGHTNPFVEVAPYPDDPLANQVLSRKFASGVIQDTDNNATDFEIR